jgi:hypothetical protein
MNAFSLESQLKAQSGFSNHHCRNNIIIMLDTCTTYQMWAQRMPHPSVKIEVGIASNEEGGYEP